MLLGLDPASELVGWAVVDCPAPRVTQCGAIGRPAGWPAWLRLRSLAPTVARLLREAHEAGVSRVLVEVPGSRQAGWNRGRYATPGVYAAACGMVCSLAWSAFPNAVVTIESDHWTEAAGRGQSKAARQRGFAAIAGLATGGRGAGDAIDAAHMAWWWAEQHGRDRDPLCHLPAARLGRSRLYRESGIEELDGVVSPRGSRVT